jgi:hypothetical protein
MKQIAFIFLILFIVVRAFSQNEIASEETVLMSDIDKLLVSYDLGYTLINKHTGEYLFPPQKAWEIEGYIDEAISGKLIRVMKYDGYVRFYGYIDINGKIVVPLKYSTLTRFYKGVAVAQIGPRQGALSNKYGVIDTKGEVVVPFEYDYISVFNSTEFSSPYVPAKIGKNRSGVLDITNGKHLTPFHFGFVKSYTPDGFVYVVDSLGKEMICNQAGKPLYIKPPKMFDIKYRTSKGKILIALDKKSYAFLDTAGQSLPQEGEDFEFTKKLLELNILLDEKVDVDGDLYYLIQNKDQRALTDAGFNPIVQVPEIGSIIRTNPIQEIPGAIEVQIKEYGKAPVFCLVAKHKLLIPNYFSRIHYPFIESFPKLIYGEKDGKFQIFTHEGRAFIPGSFYLLQPVNYEGHWLLAAFNDTLPQLYTAEGTLLNDQGIARGAQLSLMNRLQKENWYNNKINNIIREFSFPVEIKKDNKNVVLLLNGKQVFSAEAGSAYRQTDSIFVFVNGSGHHFYKLGDKGFFMEGLMRQVGNGKFGLTESLQGSKYALFNSWLKRLTDYEYIDFTYVGSNMLAAKKETGWGLLNSNYKPVTPFVYSKFYGFYNGFGAAECSSPKSTYFLNKEGVVLGSLANAWSNHIIDIGSGYKYLVSCQNDDSTMGINRVTGEVKKVKKQVKTSEYGSGDYSGGKKCYTCSGSGKVMAWVGNECNKCGGSGGNPYRCFDCNGKGQVAETKVLHARYYSSAQYAQVITQTYSKECRSCKGRGLHGLCYFCDGKGVQNARKEEVNCGTCKGTGKVY